MSTASPAAHAPGLPDEKLVGSEIGNFVIQGVLGYGGMSTVYRAKDKILERKIALKVFPRQQAETERDHLAAFLRDARTTCSITHPHVITVFSVGYASEYYYIAMELMERGSLRQLLEREGRLSFEQALNYCVQTAAGLHAAHIAGIIHRDVKPGNLMLARDHQIKVGDFGLAHHLDPDAVLQTDQNMGTPLYMAPELCAGGTPSVQSDIYALGVTFYSMLTCKRPYFAHTVRELFKQHIHNPIPRLDALRDDLPRVAQLLLERCLAKRPEQRYGSCEQLQAEFCQALQEVSGALLTPGDMIEQASSDSGSRILPTDSLIEKLQSGPLRPSRGRHGRGTVRGTASSGFVRIRPAAVPPAKRAGPNSAAMAFVMFAVVCAAIIGAAIMLLWTEPPPPAPASAPPPAATLAPAIAEPRQAPAPAGEPAPPLNPLDPVP